jgi:putative transposase
VELGWFAPEFAIRVRLVIRQHPPLNSIWIFDTTHFTRAGVAATVIEDLVSRKRLLDRVTARLDGLVDPTVDDPTRPVLLAMSDIHPQ